MRILTCLLSAGLLVAAASAATTISKPPDLGNYWHPVGNANGGTYVYADSFIAPAGDTTVARLGTWLDAINYNGGPQHSIVKFQVWGDAGGPDYSNVIASTDPFSTELTGLNLHVLDVTSGAAVLNPGTKYWFAITGVGMGQGNYDQYQVGGHTQNSVYPDNGTFWYSNDPAGQVFDGQNLTPEMAFQVYLVPEPSTLLGLLALAFIRRR
ncbi:MAG: PEP-CTERM sorting domain-containing protein [Phycisphaerae bacterium]|nr:PEP-CTERM sorting domain-containing protein [Phycisphaerae bacterium]MCZ2398680.1 PEP-CTERM sorting domain-containing protein [Phycisphaerae bacterium]NUQ48888.1 PEP-CTERM sorting domain-containing protein [Phycisphaerae bacterium]